MIRNDTKSVTSKLYRLIADGVRLLVDEHVGYNIQWSVLLKGKDYQNITKRCKLCLAEKLEIIMTNKERSLNRRSELISKCRHENKFYLSSFPPPVS